MAAALFAKQVTKAKVFGGNPMVSRKDRRSNGYVTPYPTISKKDIIKYDFFINPFYDDWADYRDGFRDWFRDFKKIKKIHRRKGRYFNAEIVEKRIQMNLKQRRLLKIRKARKGMLQNY